MPTFVKPDELLDMAGQESGPTPWLEIDQERVNLFADATDDHQYIHVDPEKAAKTPFGATIAHGYLTLSLLPSLASQIGVQPEGTAMVINYGVNKVRFLAAVKVGSRIRLRTKVLDVAEKGPGRILVTSEATVEIEGEAKPALVAETLLMYVLG